MLYPELVKPYVYQIDDKVTVAELYVSDNSGGGLAGIVRAAAVRNPADKHDPELAKELAVARLYEKLARKQRKVADALLAQQENDYVQREFSRAWKEATEE